MATNAEAAKERLRKLLEAVPPTAEEFLTTLSSIARECHVAFAIQEDPSRIAYVGGKNNYLSPIKLIRALYEGAKIEIGILTFEEVTT